MSALGRRTRAARRSPPISGLPNSVEMPIGEVSGPPSARSTRRRMIRRPPDWKCRWFGHAYEHDNLIFLRSACREQDHQIDDAETVITAAPGCRRSRHREEPHHHRDGADAADPQPPRSRCARSPIPTSAPSVQRRTVFARSTRIARGSRTASSTDDQHGNTASSASVAEGCENQSARHLPDQQAVARAALPADRRGRGTSSAPTSSTTPTTSTNIRLPTGER